MGMAELTLIDRVRGHASTHALWAPEIRVIAAVSGGSDSIAMLLLLHELASRGELVLAGLAHLNHHIRGEEADRDAAFCRGLASRLGIPAFLSDADVPALAAQEGESLEVAGRHARQRFFAETLRTGKADRVAIAHTRDDQAETVLLRLTRGAGATGLSGMVPRRGPLVRPVLDATRNELRQFLLDRGEAWREDATNLDLTNPRNFVRHQVLPNLRQINQQADAALARAADLLRIDAELLETLANAALASVSSKSASMRSRSAARASAASACGLICRRFGNTWWRTKLRGLVRSRLVASSRHASRRPLRKSCSSMRDASSTGRTSGPRRGTMPARPRAPAPRVNRSRTVSA